MRRHSLLACVVLLAAVPDGERDNNPDNVRAVPPPGIDVPDAVAAELTEELAAFRKDLADLAHGFESKPGLKRLLPDVEIYHKAVHTALKYNEFFNKREFAVAKDLIEEGRDRAAALRKGDAPWSRTPGLVVRAYRSRIDGSVQPYGLVVPPSFRPDTAHRYRLDCWFHGRGEKLSELNFLQQRRRSPGRFVPDNTIVLHLYGRYCNANKFAGEIDLLEAIESVKARYPIDENRIAVRGFSMGGAACWQFAVHYAGRWAAAAPGAGFSETPDFLRVFQKEKLEPRPWERKLWHWYDCTDYAVNLFNCPTVAYSGELDIQKQAADIMEKALQKEGIRLTHIVGPGTKHRYHPDSQREIDRRMDAILARGRNPVPRVVRFTTWTLRYDTMLWVRLDGMKEHWERTRIDAEIVNDRKVSVQTRNATGFTLNMPAGLCPLDATVQPVLCVDGEKLPDVPRVGSDRSWKVHLGLIDGVWRVTPAPRRNGKRHGLQGPIDDAFMDSFMMVRPTGRTADVKVEAWVRSELDHAIDHWRKQFRGDARIVDDSKVTDQDIANHHLVLWGTPESNSVLKRIAGRLPLDRLPHPEVSHVPLLVYPNPLNPERYVVLNSGFTFREYDYLNNARQVSKLPDWAVVDVTVPPSSRWPGRVVAADFFDENWRIKK